MAYPPNALPGGRDVPTFYGSMRVYEWGPLDGEKVVFVHGDATPSLVFSKIAQILVDAGFRVMLFGRQPRDFFTRLENMQQSAQAFIGSKLTSFCLPR